MRFSYIFIFFLILPAVVFAEQVDSAESGLPQESADMIVSVDGLVIGANDATDAENEGEGLVTPNPKEEIINQVSPASMTTEASADKGGSCHLSKVCPKTLDVQQNSLDIYLAPAIAVLGISKGALEVIYLGIRDDKIPAPTRRGINQGLYPISTIIGFCWGVIAKETRHLKGLSAVDFELSTYLPLAPQFARELKKENGVLVRYKKQMQNKYDKSHGTAYLGCFYKTMRGEHEYLFPTDSDGRYYELDGYWSVTMYEDKRFFLAETGLDLEEICAVEVKNHFMKDCKERFQDLGADCQEELNSSVFPAIRGFVTQFSHRISIYPIIPVKKVLAEEKIDGFEGHKILLNCNPRH